VPLALVAATVARSQLREKSLRADPVAAFTELTGQSLPSGVRVEKYRGTAGDNFFHTTYYWILEGDPEQLHKILVGTGFGRSDEDARWVAPSAASALEISLAPNDVVEGYEWERERDRWLLFVGPGSRAIYVL
jgi:hypothetical protein